MLIVVVVVLNGRREPAAQLPWPDPRPGGGDPILRRTAQSCGSAAHLAAGPRGSHVDAGPEP